MRGRLILIDQGLWVDNDEARACIYAHGGSSAKDFAFTQRITKLVSSHKEYFMPLELV